MAGRSPGLISYHVVSYVPTLPLFSRGETDASPQLSLWAVNIRLRKFHKVARWDVSRVQGTDIPVLEAWYWHMHTEEGCSLSPLVLPNTLLLEPEQPINAV